MIIVVAVLGAAALGAAHAFAAAETITSSPACCTFSKPSYTMDPGQVAVYQNPGGNSHNVTASARGPDGAELFRSKTIASGQVPVNGTQYLGPGTYPFVCTIHPGMAAELHVTANGTPVARPDVAVKVRSRKIERVASSGKLKLKLTASSQSDNVSLTARKGRRRLGSKHAIDLADGASRNLRLPLTAAGRKVLKDLNSAKVKVTATVPFGDPAKATRKLR